MFPRIGLAILCASVALASQVPSQCQLTSFQILCSTFYVRTIEKCISNSLPGDIFIKGNEICYVVHPERCISSDFCPAAQELDVVVDVITTTTTTTTTIKGDPVQDPEDDAKPKERETWSVDKEWPLPSSTGTTNSTVDDDEPPLLNTLGLLLFWTQFGLGLGLFVGLVIAIGLLIWCKNKNKHRQARVDPGPVRVDPSQQDVDAEANHATDHQSSADQKARPVISGPITNLNSAYDEVASDSESIYNEPVEDDTDPGHKNPFQGWTFPSSFRPIGPPPPPPPEAIPMAVRPVAKKDKSTMTDCPRPKGTLPKGNAQARSDIKSGYIASPESSLERSTFRMAGARPKQQQSNSWKAQDDFPTYNLPPLPVRSSSLRHKKTGGKKKSTATAATMS